MSQNKNISYLKNLKLMIYLEMKKIFLMMNNSMIYLIEMIYLGMNLMMKIHSQKN